MRIATLAFFLIVLPAFGTDTTTGIREADSTHLPISEDDPVKAAVDSGTAAAVENPSGSPAAAPASLDRSAPAPKKATPLQPPPPARTSTRKIPLTKRQFNYRQQVILAVGMMAFVALMMTTAQSWNPK